MVASHAVARAFVGTMTLFWKDVPINELGKAQSAFSQCMPLKWLGTVQKVASAGKRRSSFM
jgi:hypothetical protein